MKQKYRKGDLVHIISKMPSSKSHFDCDKDAIIIGSYADQFGGNDIKSYTIFIEDRGETSWYDEDELIFKEKNRLDLLETWEEKLQKKYDEKYDLDWIFENGKEVLQHPNGASIQALANCIEEGFNLWGRNGEGITYYNNMVGILNIAHPFLMINDKKRWLEFCDKIKYSREMLDERINNDA